MCKSTYRKECRGLASRKKERTEQRKEYKKICREREQV